MNKKILLWLLVFLCSLQLISAIGIRPARTLLSYSDNQVYEGTILIMNNDGQELELAISVEGELKDSVHLQVQKLLLAEEEDSKPLEFEVTIPKELAPGEHSANIVIEQVFTSGTADTFSLRQVLKHRVIVNGPYPEKYIRAKLNFHEDGTKIEAVSEVENLGSQNLESVSTTFYAFDQQNNKLKVNTDIVPIKSGEVKLLSAKLDADLLGRGEHLVSAVTSYDGNSVELTESLFVGRPEIKVLNFNQYFTAGKVNTYSLDLFNDWNTPLENVYLDILARKAGVIVSQLQTESITLGSKDTEQINGYFDARELSAGEYDFELLVHFKGAGNVPSQKVGVEILEPGETKEAKNSPLIGSGAAGETAVSASQSNFNLLLGLMVGILLLVLALLVFFLRKNKLI